MLKPKTGESLNDFLSRCHKAGVSMAEGVASWNQANGLNLSDVSSIGLIVPVSVTLAEDDKAAGRFKILANSGGVNNYFGYEFVIKLSKVKAKAKFPALLQHNVAQIVGTADSTNADDNGLYIEGAFSKATEAGRQTEALARESFPWQASCGIMPKKIKRVGLGEKITVNGRTFEGPVDVWLESELKEISFTPFGVDSNTAAIALSAKPGRHNPNPSEGNDMNLLKLARRMMNLSAETPDAEVLKALGLADGATDDAITAALETKLTALATSATPPATPGQAPAAQLAGEAVAKAVKDAMVQLAAEQAEARKTITQLCDTYKCPDIKTALLSEGVSVETARERIMAHLASGNRPLGGIVSMGATDMQKICLAATDGIALQLGVKIGTPAAGHEEFRKLGLFGICQFLLARQGENVFGLSRSQTADKFFELASSASTADFAHIFRDAANKILLAAYNESPATWRPIVRVVSAVDFKKIYGVELSAAPDLKPVRENGEYEEGFFKDSGENYGVITKGRILYITRPMIVNDELRVFGKGVQIMGSAARRMENDIVWNLITSNPTMSDGKALFHADHKNLEATSKGVISTTTLTAGRKAMRKQVGLTGEKLELRPRYILHPVAQQTDTEILVRSVTLPSDNKPAGTYNPWNDLIPISEPRLDDVSEKAWYLASDPMQAEGIEVAYLDGNENPYVEEREEFTRDALGIKIRHDFGAGVMSHRAFYKNPGE
ncbi:hypothetical protein [Desulfocurvibacter africanus]|uniref:Peptidase U35 phage prohead HK97 n=1 Tax=Desulfocurvibacter africanus subsp. africanus str. Walvis Bay TaxID=690850 RepID=F3Z2S5_DESAF|nr:hypothetical protein [Desulfocurvibacter africanus]EGJ50242.1 hypothetical protein Desaf_1913 [Desulfocurvibacter africanus subsp. africanus str. Walvis Bay]